MIGEFSASDFGNTSSREAWAKAYLSKAKDAGIPCVLWDNNVSNDGTGEAHGYIYRATNTWYPNSRSVVAAMMDTLGVTGYDLPEYQEYVKPVFSWDNVSIGDDWVELYRSESGKTIEAWKNFTVDNWKNYVNDNYKLIMIYDADEAPTIIFQGGWYTVYSNDSLAGLFKAGFTYSDITDTLNANSVSLSDMDNLFISATMKPATIYGLYAVPVSSVEPTDPTEAPTDTPTEAPTEETTSEVDPTVRGDINMDGSITVADLVILQQYLVKKADLTQEQMVAADFHQDLVVNVFDVTSLRAFLNVEV